MDLPEPGSAEEVVEKQPTVEYPRHIGGGWYVLANGEKFQGKKQAAVEANEALAVGVPG